MPTIRIGAKTEKSESVQLIWHSCGPASGQAAMSPRIVPLKAEIPWHLLVDKSYATLNGLAYGDSGTMVYWDNTVTWSTI